MYIYIYIKYIYKIYIYNYIYIYVSSGKWGLLVHMGSGFSKFLYF